MAGQVVVGLLIREDGPQAVAVTDFPKRRRAARVMSGVLSITSLMTRAAPERQPSASCRSMTVAKPQSNAKLRGPRRSEEHTSELQSLMRISYAVFCLKQKKTTKTN